MSALERAVDRRDRGGYLTPRERQRQSGDVFRFDRPVGVPDEAWAQIRRQALAKLDELAEELRGTEKRAQRAADGA